MVTRCTSAVDALNAAANTIEEKHRKNDVFSVAKETLQMMRRERSSMILGKSARRVPAQRHSSAPPILFAERRNRIAGFSKQTATSTALPKENLFTRNRSFVSTKMNTEMKSTKTKSAVSRLSRKTSESESRAKTPVGKSYTNRCVKELLNKVEHGAYTSAWNGFSGIRSATPKLVDFYSGENGGVLDAFLCNKGEKLNTCYLIDVQVGDRVGRLLKYPVNIRIGQNGETREPPVEPESSGHDDDYDDDDDYEEKCRKKKERPYPLSWSEQFQWENTKIITTSGMEKESKEVDDSSLTHHPRKFPRTTKQNEVNNACATQHHYSLKPINLSVIQKIPNFRARQKLVRDFNIGRSTETEEVYFLYGNGSQETKGSERNERNRRTEIRSSKMAEKGAGIKKGDNRPPKPSNKHLPNQSSRQEATQSSESVETKTYVNEAKTVKRDQTTGSSRTQYKTYEIRIPGPDTEISTDESMSESCTEMGLNGPGQVSRVSVQRKVLFCEPVEEEHFSTQRSYSTQTCDTEELVNKKQNETNVNRKGNVGGDSMEVPDIEISDHFQRTVESKTSKQELEVLRRSIHHSVDLETAELERDLQEMRLNQNESIS